MMSKTDFLLYGVISLAIGVFLVIYALRRLRNEAWKDIALYFVISSAGSGIALIALGLFLIWKSI
jgi:hypothetical protein